MVTTKGGDQVAAGLRKIAKKLGDGAEVRVGFLEGATYPDGTPVATVAAINNFGAPAAGIPARPFFSDMVADKHGDWGQRLGKILQSNGYDGTRALATLGEGIAGQLRQAIVATNDPPLSLVTIARKGSEKPLVDTGHLLASVDTELDEN